MRVASGVRSVIPKEKLSAFVKLAREIDEIVSRDNLWRTILSCLHPTAKAGYMVKSMRWIPTNKVGQARERVRLLRLPREAWDTVAPMKIG